MRRPRTPPHSGLTPECAAVSTAGAKDCERQATRDSRAKHGPKYNAAKRGRTAGRTATRGLDLDPDDRRYLNALALDPCAYCGQPATDLDHIQPKGAGVDSWDNLTSACGTCNKRKQRVTLLGFMLRRQLLDDGYDQMRHAWDNAGSIAA